VRHAVLAVTLRSAVEGPQTASAVASAAVPELPEVEAYRRLAERVLGRPVVGVWAPDAWYLKGGLTASALQAALIGASFSASRRIGKLLLLDASLATPTSSSSSAPAHADGEVGPTLGLRFGMSGRLVVDGIVGVEGLVYASNQARPAWDRLVVQFRDGGELRVRDPRRLGGVELDPDEARLGPDALSVTQSTLSRLLATSRAPVKARLMDQAQLAGVGNLTVDEALWRAGLDPARPACSLTLAELRRLHCHLLATLTDEIERGGSHTGDLMAERRPGGVCPKDGAPLARRRVGGRTTFSCPAHQR
jgi:formamidopyrimidine-DNA glycosylase